MPHEHLSTALVHSGSTVILIPARGGSTRVPGKNLRPLGGKPLLGHVVTAAVTAGCGRVIVSTDFDEIARVAQSFGAEVPFRRPANLASVTASSIGVLLHALNWLRQHAGLPEYIAFCPPTNPFTQADTIAGMVRRLQVDSKRQFNSIVTVFEPELHPFNYVRERADGSLEIAAVAVDGKNANNVERSQDLPKFLVRSANCVVTRTAYFTHTFGDALDESGSRSIQTFDPDRCTSWKVEPWQALDIDTEANFRQAEQALATHHGLSGPGATSVEA